MPMGCTQGLPGSLKLDSFKGSEGAEQWLSCLSPEPNHRECSTAHAYVLRWSPKVRASWGKGPVPGLSRVQGELCTLMPSRHTQETTAHRALAPAVASNQQSVARGKVSEQWPPGWFVKRLSLPTGTVMWVSGSLHCLCPCLGSERLCWRLGPPGLRESP